MTKIISKLKKAVAKAERGERGHSASNGILAVLKYKLLGMGNYRWVIAILLIATFYYVVVASNRYVTVAQVYVKSTSTGAPTVPQMPVIAGVVPPSTDALLVREYVHSADMVKHLDATLGLRDHYRNNAWDFIARLKEDPSEEEFLDYYREYVALELDAESGILTISPQAFTREFSLKLAEAIIAEAEAYINRTGQKIAADEIRFVEQEMHRAKATLNQARADMLAFQNENNLLDPSVSSAALQGVVNELKSEKIRLETREKTMESYLNPSASELVALRDKLAAVKNQITIEESKLAGSGGETLNEVSARFAEVELNVKFATDLYQSTLVGYEQARVEAYRKLKHLVIVQTPSTPDESLYPRKLYNLTTLFVLLSLAYGIVTMILATIREHRDV